MKQQQQWFSIDYWAAWLKIDMATIIAFVVFLFLFWTWESTRWTIDPVFVSISFLGMSFILLATLLPWEYWNYMHSVQAIGIDEVSVQFKWRSRPTCPNMIRYDNLASLRVAGGIRGLLTIKTKDGGEAQAFPLGYDSEAMEVILECWRKTLERAGDGLAIEVSHGFGLRAFLAHPSSAKAKWSV